MKNRRGFLASLLAIAAAPVVPALAAQPKPITARGMTTSYFAVDESPFYSTRGTLATKHLDASQAVQYTRQYLDQLQPLSYYAALSSKHLEPPRPINWVDGNLAEEAGIQIGYYFCDQFDVGLWKAGFTEDGILVRADRRLKFKPYDAKAIDFGSRRYPLNLYGDLTTYQS